MDNKKILRINLYIIISIVILYIAKNIEPLEGSKWIKYFSILTIISLIVQIIFLCKEKLSIISFPIIFIFLSYLFHFGQIILIGLVPQYEFKGFNFISILNIGILKQCSLFSLMTITLLVFGIIISKSKKENSKEINLRVCIEEIIFSKRVGLFLIYLCFPIQVYVDFKKIINSMMSGYYSTFADMGTGDGIITIIAFMGFVGFAILIMSYSVINKKVASSIYIFINVYLVITMVAGGRGHQIMLILLYLYIYNTCICKIKLKNIIIIIFIGTILIGFLNSIAILREDGIKSISQIINAINESLLDNPILKLVEEMGGSLYTPYLTFIKEGIDYEHTYGVTYLKGLITLLPNMGGIFTSIIKDSNFAVLLKEGGIGGSFIGELYFNFGYYSFIFAILIGYFIRKVHESFNSTISNLNFLKFAYIIPIFTNLLWYTRGTLYSTLRPLIYQGIILYFICRLVRKAYKY